MKDNTVTFTSVKELLNSKNNGEALKACKELFSSKKSGNFSDIEEKSTVSNTEMLTLFNLAITNKCPSVVKYLCDTKQTEEGIRETLKGGKDKKGQRRVAEFLFKAVEHGSMEAVKYLTNDKKFKDKGERQKCEMLEQDGYKILHWAVHYNQQEILKYLIDEKKYFKSHLCETTITLDGANLSCNATPLLIAIEKKNNNIVQYLVDKNVLLDNTIKVLMPDNSTLPKFIQEHMKNFGGTDNIKTIESYTLPMIYFVYSKGEEIFNKMKPHKLADVKGEITLHFKEEKHLAEKLNRSEYGDFDHITYKFTTLELLKAREDTQGYSFLSKNGCNDDSKLTFIAGLSNTDKTKISRTLEIDKLKTTQNDFFISDNSELNIGNNNNNNNNNNLSSQWGEKILGQQSEKQIDAIDLLKQYYTEHKPNLNEEDFYNGVLKCIPTNSKVSGSNGFENTNLLIKIAKAIASTTEQKPIDQINENQIKTIFNQLETLLSPNKDKNISIN